MVNQFIEQQPILNKSELLKNLFINEPKLSTDQIMDKMRDTLPCNNIQLKNKFLIQNNII